MMNSDAGFGSLDSDSPLLADSATSLTDFSGGVAGAAWLLPSSQKPSAAAASTTSPVRKRLVEIRPEHKDGNQKPKCPRPALENRPVQEVHLEREQQ